jgi:hypothetical protein
MLAVNTPSLAKAVFYKSWFYKNQLKIQKVEKKAQQSSGPKKEGSRDGFEHGKILKFLGRVYDRIEKFIARDFFQNLGNWERKNDEIGKPGVAGLDPKLGLQSF